MWISTSLPVNTSDICCHLKAHHGPVPKSRSSKIGQFHKKSRTFNPSSAFSNFYPHLITDFWITVPLMQLTHKGTPWHFSMSAIRLEALKKAFTTAPVHYHWILDTQITVETDASNYTLTAVFQLWHQMANCTPLRSTPGPFPAPDSTMMSTTKSSLRFLKLSNEGNFISKALELSNSTVSQSTELAILFNDQILTCQQAWWSEYLSGFNLTFVSITGKLGTKLNALTR